MYGRECRVGQRVWRSAVGKRPVEADARVWTIVLDAQLFGATESFVTRQAAYGIAECRRVQGGDRPRIELIVPCFAANAQADEGLAAEILDGTPEGQEHPRAERRGRLPHPSVFDARAPRHGERVDAKAL